MVFQFSVHRFKMIYWSGPKKDEYTEELRPPPSDNEQNRKNVAVGSGIFFLQKAMAKAGTLKNNDKDSERNVILVVLEKCSKRMSRSYRGVSHKWIKDGFFAVADWSRHQKNTTLVTVKVFLVSKGFWLLLFCFFFFFCFAFSFHYTQSKWKCGTGKGPSISIMDIFMYVQIKSNGIVSLLHIYLLIFGDSWTQIWTLLFFISFFFNYCVLRE